MKPGAIFAGWLISAGLIRTFIEFFRPDQPRIADSFVTYSMFVSFLMAIFGVVMLLIRYQKLSLALADGWEEQYQIKPVEKNLRTHSEITVTENVVEVEDEAIKPEKKKPTLKAKENIKKSSEKKKTPAKRTASKSKTLK
jgi:hypothetical protein